MIKTSLLVVPALVLLASSARADCNYPTFDFFPEKNGGVVVDMKVTDGRARLNSTVVALQGNSYTRLVSLMTSPTLEIE